MNYQTVKVKVRDDSVSPGERKRNREAGELPIVLSRAGTSAVPFSVDTAAFQKAVRRTGKGGIMQLVEDGGAKHLGLLKELQWNPVTRKLNHASFQEVKRNQMVATGVTLVYVGEPQPVTDRTGQFIKNQESIEVRAKVSSLPEHIVIDISSMHVGDVLTAGAVPMPDGCEAVHPDAVLCSVTTPTVVHLETPSAETDAVGEAAEGEGQAETETTSETGN
jgi:large subunit ribosomal protein L25